MSLGVRTLAKPSVNRQITQPLIARTECAGCSGMAILEVAIGIILVFGLLSLITSAVVEIITRRLAIRSTNLRLAIEGMLDADKDDQSTSQKIYDHPLIDSLGRPGRDPSYILDTSRAWHPSCANR